MEATITVIVSSFLLLSAVVDSLRCRVDSFHPAASELLWILSTSELDDTWIPTQRHTVVIVIVVVMDIISAQAWQKQDKHYSCTRSHRSLATR